MNETVSSVKSLVWALFALTMLLDVAGQTAFKLGLGRLRAPPTGFLFWRALASNPFILAGVAAYGIEAVTWMYVLGHAPMSVVGPMSALSYVGAVAAASVCLHERVDARRWWGAALVTLGSGLLAAAGA